MSKAGLDNRHRNKDGEISHKHGNTLIRTLRKIYGQGFAAGYPETEKLSEVLLQLNETSMSQLHRDHETGHLEHNDGPINRDTAFTSALPPEADSSRTSRDFRKVPIS